ncbi:TonB-dependent receptor domain-containing protein [Sphingopyxis alaskensis]|jgi:outer membrane receptor protein involved in Fe transport|uniref:TonB-dependent receptor n=1 Tax=Sphingopyxis alaskensis (strain DSM 13593 / LMG 18877 / RB2256) TaxID=317655 RepID=Q1GTS9_SPHAL|nr:TonB-dependent receptor [Sphingopyxis alaskensis]ABF52943.1 TonB-dependent receptor [Sphingopyxis alaskensis RB2256]MCM3419651.1 TonB-dependent receptor [Sphingopyxis alaskensis]
MTKSHLLLGAAAFAVAISVSQPVLAQESEDSVEAADETENPERAIVVTGSRIARPNLESSVPLTAVPVGDLTDRGDIQLGDALNELPSLRATFSQANSTRFIGTAGINLLDLRGLGTERTLVLVNGRRHVTSSPGSYDVDTNTIPVDLLERVDVITGGNSAIYGSDAVAGVVNFITKRDFDGIKLRGQGGVSTYGDRGSYFVSGIAGKNFMDGRANVAVAVEYARANPVFFADRSYLGAETGVGPAGFEVVEPAFRLVNGVPTPVPNRNNNGVPNTRFLPAGFTFNTVSLGGMVLTSCPAATGTNAARVAAVCTGELSPTSGGRFSYNYAFQPDGTLLRNGPENGLVDNRGAGGSALFGLGASGLEDAMLLPGIERIAVNLLSHVEISPAFEPFIEAKYVRINATQQSTQPTFIASALNPIFSINNPFLTDQARQTLQTILAPGATTFQMQRFNNDLGTRAEDHRRETYRIVAGVRGDLGTSSNLTYEVAFNYGRTETYYETGGNVDVAKFNRATNAVRNSAGQIVCAVNADANPANDDPACAPLNPFGFGAPSQAAKDYVLYTSSREQWAEQINAVAFLSGSTEGFFSLPGGPVGFAIGGEYRREDAYSAFDPFTRSGATFLNAIAVFEPPSVEIKEVFGELRIPMLRDVPLAHELTLEGAARYSDYGGSVGGVWAYNFGGIYAPIPDIRFRAGYARSVRAPNLGNLFATRSETFANGLIDPCSQTVINDNPNRVRNCAAAGIPTTMVVDGNTIPWVNTPASGVSGFNQGNPNLIPEVGKSLTIGGVFQPRFVPGLAITVDYYRIKVTNVIQGLTGQAIINRCYDDPVGLDNPFCAAVFRRRDPNPLIDFTFDGQANRVPAPGQPTLNFPVLGPAFLNQPFNFAARKAEGVDFDVSYRRTFDNGVMLNLRGVATYNLNREDFSFITDPSRSTRIHGTLGDPIWAANFNANVDFGTIDVGYSARYVGKQAVDAWEVQHSHQGRPPTNPDAFPFRKYPDRLYHAFRVGFEPDDKYRFYFGVDNVFDTRPPFDLTGTGAGSGIFPVQGRFFYAGIQASL